MRKAKGPPPIFFNRCKMGGIHVIHIVTTDGVIGVCQRYSDGNGRAWRGILFEPRMELGPFPATSEGEDEVTLAVIDAWRANKKELKHA